jgi:hypothetical protein
MKEFVRFSTTDVFVPVSQLSTRDLFDFLENLKIKQDMFLSWISRQVRSVEQRALWFPYSRLFFGIVFKRLLFLEYLGFLQSQLWCSSWIFDTSLSERCLNCWLVKKNSWLLSLRCHVVNRLKVDRHGWGLLFSLAMFEEKSLFKVGCHVENVTWLSLLFLLRFFLFCFGEKKNLSPNFGVIVFFLDLVDFQSTGSWDFSSLLLTRGP